MAENEMDKAMTAEGEEQTVPQEEAHASESEEGAQPSEQETSGGATEEQGAPKKKKKEKKKLTKEQKKRRAIKALIIVGAIILVFGIFISGVAIGNVVGAKALLKQAKNNFAKVEYTEHEQLTPSRDEDGWQYFTLPSDREDFKVLQLTDVHIGAGSFSQRKDSWAMNAVATMVRQEQPDLVVVTGDIAYPVPFQAGTFNNLNATKIFATLMESLGVYWTFAFGNHDTEAYSMYSRDEICKYYEEHDFKYCLFERGFSDQKDQFGKIDRGFGNHIINVKNEDGIVIKSLVMLDSHSYTDGDYFGVAWKYDNIHQSQVDWYTAEMDKIRAANVAKGGADEYAKNLMFFHIPLMEYREAWRALKETYGGDITPGATAVVKAENTESGKQGEVVYYSGKMGEKEKVRHGIASYGVFCGYGTDQVFEEGGTHGLQGIFCGHDHYNNFSIEYNNIRLTYGMSIDYLAYTGIYKQHLQRGCTVIEIAQDKFEVTPKNYYADYSVKYEAN